MNSKVFDAKSNALVFARTPLLPIRMLVEVYAAPDPIQALRDLFRAEPLLLQALRLASPDLAEAVEPWVAGSEPRNPSMPLRVLAYVARMTWRPTPFGICAGIGAVDVGDATTLRVEDDARRTHTRPDMGMLSALTTELQTGERRQEVRYVVNDAVATRGDRLYVTNPILASASSSSRGSFTEQRPISLKNTAAVAFVRERIVSETRYRSIVEMLVDRFEATPEQAERLVDQLVEAGVLIPELRKSPIGDPIAEIADCVDAIDESLGANLRGAIRLAGRLDAVPLTERTEEAYGAVRQAFAALTTFKVDNVAQVDLHSPVSGTLNGAILDEAALLGDYWMRLGQRFELASFKRRFMARYEGTERMVPLLELADPNIGLGMPELPEAAPENTARRDAILMRLACEAMRDGAEEIELLGDDLKGVLPELDPAEPIGSIEVGFQIAGSSPEAVDRGEYTIYPGSFLASTRAARSAGRFMHLFDSQTLEQARRVANLERDPNAIAAEVVFVPPTARYSNVLIRPRILDTEIRIGTGGHRSPDSLALDDLWVGIDREGHFFVWSQSRSSRILPLESHLFNTESLSPNVCRFLGTLAEDGRRKVQGFPWGTARALTARPRVRVGRIVLAPRTWQLPATELLGAKRDVTQTIARWRSQWSLPRFVLLRTDRLLPIDLDSSVAAAVIADQIPAGSNIVRLEEMLPAPADTWVEGKTGKHVMEFVASLLPTRVPASRPPDRPIVLAARPRRGPGSNWLYAKLHVGAQAAEGLLLRQIAPLVERFRAAGDLDRWFFLRYADPEFQLRVRFLAGDNRARALREALLTSFETLLEQEHILRYALDTYDPEYERYGGLEEMNATERFFAASSDACLRLLAETDEEATGRVEATVRSFGAWIGGNLESLALECFAPAARRKLSDADRSALRRLTANEAPSGDPILEEALCGQRRGERLASLFHMHCNRMGVQGSDELRAIALVRALVLARQSRVSDRRELVRA